MNKEKLIQVFAFVLLVSLCAFPLFYNLGSVGAQMWDESRNGVNALEMFYNHNYLVTYFEEHPDMWNTKPPLFIWSVVVCMKFLGTTVLALRLPSALSGLVIVIYGFFFSKKMLSDWRPGFFAGLTVVTSVGFIDYHVARNGDFDAMLAMWIFLYCAQFFVYLETKQRKHLIYTALFVALAILTKGIAGGLFVPGLLLLTLLNKNYRAVLKKKELYVFAALGLLLGVSYYFIRELYNPGYIDAVIKNELVGRYMEVKEYHRADAWFYLERLQSTHFTTWLYWMPISIFIVLATKNELVKKVGIFVIIQIVCYLLIISFSETKLKWYDAPLYPFLGLLIGLAFYQLLKGIEQYIGIENQWYQLFIFLLFGAGVFSLPAQSLERTSIFVEKEVKYAGLFYGDFFDTYYYLFPQQKSLKVVYYGYNPHLVFYSTIHQHQGRIVEPITQNAEISMHDTVMICDRTMWPNFNPDYRFDTLYQEGENKFVITLTDSSNSPNHAKIVEKKFFQILGRMENNLEWMDGLKKKAKLEKRNIRKQMMYDAMWTIGQETPLTVEEETYFKNKYQL